MTKFNKTNLFAGMAVVCRNGKCFIVKNGINSSLTINCTLLTGWNNDLICTYGYDDDHSFDIMEVWSLSDNTKYVNDVSAKSFKHRTLLWKRVEVKKVTIADIEAKFGCKVEVVNNH